MSADDPLPARVHIRPAPFRVTAELPAGGRWTSLPELCHQALIPLRATAPPRPVWIYVGEEHVRTQRFDVVGVPVSDLDGREAALRALEVLAHGFHDHAARFCVCGRGLFGAPG